MSATEIPVSARMIVPGSRLHGYSRSYKVIKSSVLVRVGDLSDRTNERTTGTGTDMRYSDVKKRDVLYGDVE